MSMSYNLPPDMNEKEKAIGGVLTFIQFFWLIGGAVLGILVYMGIYSITKIQVISIVLGFITLFSGIPFAFIKKQKMPLFKYLMIKRKFDKKNKKLINRRNFE